MPMYYFHSEDSRMFHDVDGTDLSNIGAARIEAVRFAGALLSERPEALWESTRWRLAVTNEQKMILFTIEVNTVLGAAVTPWSMAESA